MKVTSPISLKLKNQGIFPRDQDKYNRIKEPCRTRSPSNKEATIDFHRNSIKYKNGGKNCFPRFTRNASSNEVMSQHEEKQGPEAPTPLPKKEETSEGRLCDVNGTDTSCCDEDRK